MAQRSWVVCYESLAPTYEFIGWRQNSHLITGAVSDDKLVAVQGIAGRCRHPIQIIGFLIHDADRFPTEFTFAAAGAMVIFPSPAWKVVI